MLLRKARKTSYFWDAQQVYACINFKNMYMSYF